MTTDNTSTTLLSLNAHEAISQRAYEIWMSEGCQDGTDNENWLRAEREYQAETAEFSFTGISHEEHAFVTEQVSSASAA